MFIETAFTFSSGYSLGVLLCAGLCLSGLRQFKPFWPLAFVQLALVAIFLAALRRFRGAVLFRG